MRIERTGLVGGISVAALAGGTALLVSSVAHSDTTPDDPPVSVGIQAPESVSSEFTEDTAGVKSKLEIKNGTGDEQSDITVKIETSSQDDDADSALRVVPADERCSGEDVVICELDSLPGDTIESIDLRLFVADDEIWRQHPVTWLDAELNGATTDITSESVYVYSQDDEDDA